MLQMHSTNEGSAVIANNCGCVVNSGLNSGLAYDAGNERAESRRLIVRQPQLLSELSSIERTHTWMVPFWRVALSVSELQCDIYSSKSIPSNRVCVSIF